MTTILCIETAEKFCSVALSRDGKCIDDLIEKSENAHAKSLTLMIESLLKRNNTSFDKLEAVAVSSGPGSYTGLRIGVSTAKGICWTKDLPLISIPTLDSLIESGLAKYKDYDTIIPNIDARRNEVFMKISSNNEELLPTQPVVLDENPLLNYKDNKFLIVGSGSDKFKPV